MSTDFKELLQDRTGDVEPPKPLPSGDYDAVIESWQTGHSSKKQTPFVEFTCRLTAPKENVNEDEFEEYGGMAKLSEKTFAVPYYLTENSKFRLAQLFQSLKLDDNVTLSDNLPNTIGAEVIATCAHQMGENGIFARVEKIEGAG